MIFFSKIFAVLRLMKKIFSESSKVVVDEKLAMRAAIFVGLLFSLCNMLPKHYLIETEDGNEGDGGKGAIIKN